ncbi:hypothetical protein [Bizionia paragorgiae]|jgi:cation transport ATPase|uniref:Uncharacterized protein n=1 Tax=Bizionia paragorgiae TaxID=283786 RepID=A0A1H3Y5E9_BIZPA|nr:hypothetical protein [Bizionia paragorgiae]MDX1270842.1 hypothetical protein [Bizionia paragorgiae]SEA06261.1 hypothetical protein SAMN04487990_10639 [Bizionia paragorgiae]
MIKSIQQFLNNTQLIKRIQYFLIAMFVLLIALDVYLAVDTIDNNTISSIIKNNTDNGLFVLTYFWGAVAANLFFTTRGVKLVSPTVGTIILFSIALIIIVFNLGKLVTDFMEDHYYGIYRYSISMVFGIAVGLLFWRQEGKAV